MRARLIGIAAVTVALCTGASNADDKLGDVKTSDVERGVVAAATVMPLAERVDGLVRGKDLKPGVSMGLANAEGTVQLSVTELEGGRVVRLINLSTHALMGEWRLSSATPQETDNAAAVVLLTMGMVPRDGLGKAPAGAMVHVH